MKEIHVSHYAASASGIRSAFIHLLGLFRTLHHSGPSHLSSSGDSDLEPHLGPQYPQILAGIPVNNEIKTGVHIMVSYVTTPD